MEQKAELKHLFLAPIMGLAFAIFLPAIAIIMTIGIIGMKIGSIVYGGVERAAVFGWRPSEAYLAGKSKKKEKDEYTKTK